MKSPAWINREFAIGLAFGPLVWFGFYVFFQPVVDLGWPLANGIEFLYLAALIPVIEELSFRGLLQSQLLRWSAARNHYLGITLANLLCSILFMSMHLFSHSLVWTLSVIFPSLAYGYFRDKYGSVLPCIILHCVYNSGYYWLFRPV